MVDKHRVVMVFLILGLVSLFADMVYEGGRSISGAYLAELNAPASSSTLIGVGEFLGLVFRFFSGYISAVIQSPLVLWGSVFLGYAITALCIPLIGFTSSWEIVVLLYVLDRVGKGLRAPARDVVLAEVSEGIGVGRGFGVHELLDQLGAFIGPLIVSIVLVYYGYRVAYFTLLIPGLISLILVATAWTLYPRPKATTTRRPGLTLKGYNKGFWLYTIATCILALGFIHWSIASYYLRQFRGLPGETIGLIYAVAMLVDALVAVPLGVLFDKAKVKVLLLIPLLIPFSIGLLVYTPIELIYLAAIPWGIVMCSEESIMRATIAVLVEPSKRPLAYGLFGLLFGSIWALGGFIYTAILGSPVYMVIYAVATSLLSLYLYYLLVESWIE